MRQASNAGTNGFMDCFSERKMNVRHRSIHDQHAHLSAMSNYRRLSWYADEVASIWKKWLSRRDRRKRLPRTPP